MREYKKALENLKKKQNFVINKGLKQSSKEKNKTEAAKIPVKQKLNKRKKKEKEAINISENSYTQL